MVFPAVRRLALVELEILALGRCVDPGQGPEAVILAGEEAGDAYIKERRRRRPRQFGIAIAPFFLLLGLWGSFVST